MYNISYPIKKQQKNGKYKQLYKRREGFAFFAVQAAFVYGIYAEKHFLSAQVFILRGGSRFPRSVLYLHVQKIFGNGAQLADSVFFNDGFKTASDTAFYIGFFLRKGKICKLAYAVFHFACANGVFHRKSFRSGAGRKRKRVYP